MVNVSTTAFERLGRTAALRPLPVLAKDEDDDAAEWDDDDGDEAGEGDEDADEGGDE